MKALAVLRVGCALALTIMLVANAQSATGQPADDDIRVQLAKALPGAKPEDVRATPVPGLYEITVHGTTGYISADGKYLILGDLYDVATRTNLTDQRRMESRARLLATVKDDDTIIFGPADAKHTITVFTDTDCGYCRKLHSEIAEINKLGIRVRYAAYPRGGPGSPSWETMQTVWCSKDRREALTRAKLDEPIKAAKCGVTPVAREYNLGVEMGINGTPAIFTPRGDYIGGYLPPAKLAAYLDELDARANAANAGKKTSQPVAAADSSAGGS